MEADRCLHITLDYSDASRTLPVWCTAIGCMEDINIGVHGAENK